jgi:hypothetical protein
MQVKATVNESGERISPPTITNPFPRLPVSTVGGIRSLGNSVRDGVMEQLATLRSPTVPWLCLKPFH